MAKPFRDRLLKVYAALAAMMDDAQVRPDELRRLSRWKDIYDLNDELLLDCPPAWLRKAHAVVRFSLDEVKSELMANPRDPGCLREILRAFSRLNRIVNDVRNGRLI